MDKTIHIPSPTNIGRSDRTSKLYEIEGRRDRAIEAAAHELEKLLEIPSADFWAETMPLALCDTLDGHAAGMAIAAAVGFLQSLGWTVTPPAREPTAMRGRDALSYRIEGENLIESFGPREAAQVG